MIKSVWPFQKVKETSPTKILNDVINNLLWYRPDLHRTFYLNSIITKHWPLLISLRREVFYTKQYIYNSVANSLINTKLSHHTISSTTIQNYLGEISGVDAHNFLRCRRIKNVPQIRKICLLLCATPGHMTCYVIAVCHCRQQFCALSVFLK